MYTQEHWPRPRLWIVRLCLFVERFIPIPLVVSALLFAIPLSVAGIMVAQATGTRLFTRGVVISLMWLAIAPMLLTLAYNSTAKFFDDNRQMFLVDDQAHQNLQTAMLDELGSPKYLLLSIPLPIICNIVLLNSIYSSCHPLVRMWSIVTFGVLFYFGGMGFWGISRFNYMFEVICNQELRFDPYHGDTFGGLSFLGQFNIRGPQYFFSGALVFPIVLEVIDTLPDNELIHLGLWGVVIAFFGFGIAGFLVPQIKIKDIISNHKDNSLASSELVLQDLLTELKEKCNSKETAEVTQLKINVYYEYFHKRITSVKEWPFDWKIILQILSSLVAPLMIVIVEALSP